MPVHQKVAQVDETFLSLSIQAFTIGYSSSYYLSREGYTIHVFLHGYYHQNPFFGKKTKHL